MGPVPTQHRDALGELQSVAKSGCECYNGWEDHRANHTIPSFWLDDRPPLLRHVGENIPVSEGICEINATVTNYLDSKHPKTRIPNSRFRPPLWWDEDIKDNIKLRKELTSQYIKNMTPENYMLLNKQSAITKKLIRKKRRNSWKQYCNTLRKDTRSKKVWQIIKRLKNNRTFTDSTPFNWKTIEEIKQHICPLTVSVSPYTFQSDLSFSDHILLHPIEKGEIEIVLETVRSTSPGKDEITYDMIKHFPDEAFRLLIQHFNYILRTQEIPDAWKKEIRQPSYYRGASRSRWGKSGCDVGKRTVPVRKYDSILKALSSLENANIFVERTILSDNAGETSLGSSTESYPAFARIALTKNLGKNLNQVTCPDRDSNPGHLVSRPDALTVTPQVWTHTVHDVYLWDFTSCTGVSVWVNVRISVVPGMNDDDDDDEGRRGNPMPARSLLLSNSTNEAARLNVPIRRKNHYQQWHMPSLHMQCEKMWDLT
ncbi:hypothetical protein ANN_10301 [Periplaneta americana]|uniref:Uncharacterized protein n=1 Tax=Periplaneta americana TaxID=6978 RepID=A0ABQ8TNX4_PERAM|nr:hypothetical protein ANN_10301 [Periplaneta americana]